MQKLSRTWIASVVCFALNSTAHATESFAALEKRIGAKIGLMAVDTGTGQKLAHRRNEKFLMCSTFKLLLAAHILHRVDTGEETLSRMIAYEPKDLLEWAPITSKHTNMTVEELNAASVQYSDNTAANLLLQTVGGPAGLTHYFRSLGDKITHLDRIEPFLNKPLAGKDLDTTTPAAMAEDLRQLFFGTALSKHSRDKLEQWALGNTTGARRLKAGLPASWRIADKTGTCDTGATNDIGVFYPSKGSPIVIATYFSGCNATREVCEAVVAEIAKIVVARFGHR
jgi:beta-lactamase class A